jgi:hypothetical protein
MAAAATIGGILQAAACCHLVRSCTVNMPVMPDLAVQPLSARDLSALGIRPCTGLQQQQKTALHVAAAAYAVLRQQLFRSPSADLHTAARLPISYRPAGSANHRCA